MSKIVYTPRNFSNQSLSLILIAEGIIEEYRNSGFDLTLRQLYYQFVARDAFPDDWVDPDTKSKNSDRNYKKLGSIINDARLAGLIDWLALVDRTRYLRSLPHWSSPASILRSAAAGYSIDKWVGQNYRLEVWIEKDALVGVIQTVCERYDVPYFSCRGYTSQSEMWTASQRLIEYKNRDQQPVIIHLGDHDPSGIDMSRDILDRIRLFCSQEDVEVEVRRIALNMDQIEEYQPPPNPAKISDSRATEYIKEYGRESWELDALEPSVISGLIENKILEYLNVSLFNSRFQEQEEGKKKIQEIADHMTA